MNVFIENFKITLKLGPLLENLIAQDIFYFIEDAI